MSLFGTSLRFFGGAFASFDHGENREIGKKTRREVEKIRVKVKKQKQDSPFYIPIVTLGQRRSTFTWNIFLTNMEIIR